MEKYKVVKLSDIVEISSGQTAPQEEKYYIDGKYNFIRVKDFSNLAKGYIGDCCDRVNDKAVKEKRLRLFDKGTIVFPKSGMAILKNNIGILKEDAYVVNHLATLKIKNDKEVNGEYLLYYLKNFGIPNLASDISYPSIRLSDVKEISVKLPDLNEQKKIAKFLSTIEELKEQKIINNLRIFKLRTSRFLEIFGHPFDSTNKRWGEKELQELANLKSGFAQKPRTDKNGIPQLRTYNINENCSINLNLFKYINPIKTLDAYLIRDGDVLFNNTNSKELVGKTAIYYEDNNKYVFSNHITRIRIKSSELLPEYLFGFICILYKERIFERICKKWVNQAGIDSGTLSLIKIPLPPIKLQKKYALLINKIYKLELRQVENYGRIQEYQTNKIREIFHSGK